MFSRNTDASGQFFQFSQQNIMLSAVNAAHPVQVALKISFLNEMMQDHLIRAGHCGRKTPQSVFRLLQKPLRQHQIADSYGRRYGLGKRPNINDPAVPIRSLQRRNRFSLIPELTVIVIFDQITPFLSVGPLQKLHPPADGHDNPQRVLVGGHHIGCIRPRNPPVLPRAFPARPWKPW